MDTFTEQHFAAWLRNYVADDERELRETQIRALLAENPGLLIDHEWPQILALAEVECVAFHQTKEDERIAWSDCPQCNEQFNLARGFSAYDPPTIFCGKFCAEASYIANAPLVKPQPRGVQLNGWDI